jgi:signal transduction histidine kinase
MLGWGWQSVHDPKELPRVLAKWAAAVREGAPWEDSFPLRGADGEYRLFLSRAFPIRDSSGNVVRWFGTNTDISEHAKAQEVLRRTEKLAAAGRLAASIAHEINNPLEAVTNLLYLVAQDDGVPDRLKEYLRMADEELQRVAHIARQTLGFYKETTYPTHFLVSDVLDEVVRLHGRKLTSKQIAVHRQYRDPGEIVASRGELRQVFSNLVSNAIDATNPPGKLFLRTATTRSSSGERVLRISIADAGSGIAREHLTRIFEPFFTTKKDVGTGLGLWVSREIVAKLGGTMRVRSRVGQGTVFSVTLPAAAAALAPLRQSNVG